MSVMNSKSSREGASNAARYALVGLLLTSVHHAYGAYVYATPWRYHAVFVSGAAALLIFGSLTLLRRRPSGLPGTLARWLFGLTTLLIPVLAFGVFEGFYNHLVKNVLYFAGLSATQMAQLFPSPTYEMPNDALFEITGILQVLPAALAAWHLYRMVQTRRLERRVYAESR
jgi:hypothetical protein